MLPAAPPRRATAPVLLRGLAALSLSAALLAAAPARAEESAPPTAFSLTISGGVSLGAYEAGLLSYLLDWLRSNAGRSDLRLATGASAGSVNAILSVMERCREESRSPTESLFYRMWVPLGFDQLFDGTATLQSAFTRAWFEKIGDALERELRRGLPLSCDVVVGIAVTRVIPRRVQIGSPDLQVDRMEERFVLRLQGRGPGVPPRLTNYVGQDGRDDVLLLPEDDRGEVSLASLRQLLFASSAVPLAFDPVPLRHCVVRPPRPARCPAAEAEEALFVDGSFFDSSPLRLAASLARAGLRTNADGTTQWDPAPTLGARHPLDRLRLAFVSPDLTAYPQAEEATDINAQTTVTELAVQEAGAFLETARSKNLYTLLEELPGVGRQLFVPSRHFPAASSPMQAFFGFFETAFRRYDFTLGMYDAHRVLVEQVLPRLPGASDLESFSFPEDRAFGQPDWQPFQCLLAIFDAPARAAEACRGDALSDLRILAQTSLDRLYDECRPRAGAAPIDPGQLPCLAARAGGAPPAVPGVRNGGVPTRRRPREGEVPYLSRLLALHGFQFHDLEPSDSDSATDPDAALRTIRFRLSEVLGALSRTQPLTQRLALARIGQLAANALLYIPPPHLAWFGLGREFEGGYSYGLPGQSLFARALRLHAALLVDNPYELISTVTQPWGVTPLGGIEVRPPPLNSPALQIGFVARGGWQFSSGDSLGARKCTSSPEDFSGCSRLSLQAGVYGVILEALRLQVMAEWLPPTPAAKGLFAVSPNLGVQLVF